jgi:hypothetical protein
MVHGFREAQRQEPSAFALAVMTQCRQSREFQKPATAIVGHAQFAHETFSLA